MGASRRQLVSVLSGTVLILAAVAKAMEVLSGAPDSTHCGVSSGRRLRHPGSRARAKAPGAPTVSALLAGEIPLAFETMLVLQPHVRAGTLRALAVTSLRRSAIMPDIPTTAEAGFPGLVADNSYALFAPSGTPIPIITRLHDATVVALASPEVHDRLRKQGAEVVAGSPADLAAYVAAEIPKWAALAH